MSNATENTGWYLILMVWGNRYSDDFCNRLIHSAFKYSKNCRGAVILTDRCDRDIDPRGKQVKIDPYFNIDAFKKDGLAIKISMFEIDAVPKGATCVYLDLDSLILGELDSVAALSEDAELWTIDVFPRRFNARTRRKALNTQGKTYRVGNSSAFVYKNKFEGNPTQQFRALHAAGDLPADMAHDDKFIGWACQQQLRGFPTDMVCYFRVEFFWPTMWLADLMSKFRKSAREKIKIITFAGPNTKLDILLDLPDGASIRCHHNRIARWDDQQTNNIKSRIIDEYMSFPNSNASP
ncbi:MAG: hypothetical protein KIH44_014280 [Octadecabacter sp.]|nr:hypothetical protein [Octadecabacter sp.]